MPLVPVPPSKPLIRFWVRFHEPSEDFRPLTDPPSPPVISWWCTGTDANSQAIICAVVDAHSVNDAKSVIRSAWTPSEIEEPDEKPAGWMPDPGRFPPRPPKSTTTAPAATGSVATVDEG